MISIKLEKSVNMIMKYINRRIKGRLTFKHTQQKDITTKLIFPQLHSLCNHVRKIIPSFGHVCNETPKIL